MYQQQMDNQLLRRLIMKTRIVLVLMAIAFGALLLIAAVGSNRASTAVSTSGTGQAAGGNSNGGFSPPTPASSNNQGYHYGITNLLGATPEQVGQFAVEYAQQRATIYSGVPQVMFTRPITNDELGALGLDCIYFGTIEKPPLMLVILKGDFGRVGFGTNTASPHFKYVVYVFDLWAANASSTIGVVNGGLLRVALNDPNLPSDTTDQAGPQPHSCQSEPTPKRHYGDIAPTAVLPTPMNPRATPFSSTPIPWPPLPPALATRNPLR
jgi:hypothetical protein